MAARFFPILALGIFACAQPAMAWDYLTNGSDSIYAGHSTGQVNESGTAALSFACTKSARGAIMFMLETQLPTFAADTDVVIDLYVGDRHFPIDARTGDAAGSQMAMTWGRHASVNDAARAIHETVDQVIVKFGDTSFQFAGGAGSPNFLKMLKACGGVY